MTRTEYNEYRLLETASREFAQKVLLKSREENDRFPYADLDRSVFEKAFGLDFFHLWLPEKMGGLEGHIGKLCTILIHIAEVDAAMAVTILTNAMAQEIMMQAGEHDRLDECCAKSASPEDALISFSSFTNPVEMPPEITAVQKDDTVLLTGIATGMVMGSMAEKMIVPARVAGDTDCSWFIVATDRETVTVGDPVIGLGLHACPATDIRLNETPGVMIGERGKASEYFLNMLGRLIPAGAAIATGIMKGSFADALKYSQARMQGGRKINAWSEVQLLLSNMALKVRNAEMLIDHVTATCTNDSVPDRLAASIPAFDHACDVTSDGVQILGGYGYMEDYSQEKRYRDALHLHSLFGVSYLKKIHYLKTCCKIA